MNVAVGCLLAFGVGVVIGLALVALTVAIGFAAQWFNVRANRRISRQLAEFDAANPQFNEDHPEWNHK